MTVRFPSGESKRTSMLKPLAAGATPTSTPVIRQPCAPGAVPIAGAFPPLDRIFARHAVAARAGVIRVPSAPIAASLALVRITTQPESGRFGSVKLPTHVAHGASAMTSPDRARDSAA